MDLNVDTFLSNIIKEKQNDDYKELEEKYDALSQNCDSLMSQLTAEKLSHNKTKMDCQCSDNDYIELKTKISALKALYVTTKKKYDNLVQENQIIESENDVILKELEFLRAENHNLKNKVGEKRKRIDPVEEFCYNNGICYKTCIDRINSNMPFKKGACRDSFEEEGTCPRGKKCWYAHTTNEIRFFRNY